MTFDSLIAKLLQENIPALPLIIMETSLGSDFDELLRGSFGQVKLGVVDDPHTREVLGERVYKAVRTHARHISFDHFPKASDTAIDYVRRQSQDCDALVAVGTGTINDICKYAAHLDNKPYAVFPTAASMNGYLSANASISVAGYKKTCAARMPAAVFCDMSVIAAAPARLSKSGLGDCLARPTAQADWLLSHLLLNTPYNETPFQLLAPYEPQLFDSARGIVHGDRETVALLMKILLLSGLGMTIASGSYPASQAEHMIAHAYEMRASCLVPRASWLHGEAIGVTTLTMAQMQEQLLHGKPKLRMDNFPEEEITTMFGDKVTQEAKKAFAIKQTLIRHPRVGGDLKPHGTPPKIPTQGGDDGIKNWSSIAARIEKITIPPARLQSILEAAECPTTPEKLGWDVESYNTVAGIARYLRERFTFLDITPA